MVTEQISILIIESQPLMRAALRTTFAAEGISVVGVLAGTMEALRTVSELNPKVVLVAIGTPGWAELEMIQPLRKLMPACAIVALVTGEIPGQEHTASSKGADLVLSKAAPWSDLLKAVKEISQKRMYPAPVQAD